MPEVPQFDHPELLDNDWARRAERTAKSEFRKRRRRSFIRRHRAKLASVVPVFMVVLLVGAYLMLNDALPSQSAMVPDTTRAASPTTETSMVEDVRVDPKQPFVGTPAANWADGENGIVAPEPAAMSGLTTRQVADAYAKVRQLLITARLDRAVLEGHDVGRVTALFAKDAQTQIRPDFNDPVRSYGYATRIAEGQRLLPVPPKVNGRMWAEAERPGELLVHTDYVFAYAFHTDHPDRLVNAMDIVAVNRFQLDYYVVLPSRWEKNSRGLWPGGTEWFTYSMACEASRKGFLAPAYTERLLDVGVTPAQRDWKDYFDPNIPMPDENSCPG